jgi:hypothetical protein
VVRLLLAAVWLVDGTVKTEAEDPVQSLHRAVDQAHE